MGSDSLSFFSLTKEKIIKTRNRSVSSSLSFVFGKEKKETADLRPEPSGLGRPVGLRPQVQTLGALFLFFGSAQGSAGRLVLLFVWIQKGPARARGRHQKREKASSGLLRPGPRGPGRPVGLRPQGSVPSSRSFVLIREEEGTDG